jgi:glycosyltransferase involved in cell wall biosynthesis
VQALQTQTLPTDSWELLVIDNRSDDPLDGHLHLNWHPHARILREDTLGLTPARLRGIREARGELLVFVDDDNVLEPDYLEVARQIAAERPFLGAWSGQCLPEFEVDPPEWSRRYWGNLCIRQFDLEIWSNLPRLAETMPAGAGLCVRRDVAEFYLDLHERGGRGFQFDRTGDSLVSGGDNDLAACSTDLGLGVGLTPRLRLTHLIAPQRLTVAYIDRLNEGIHFSSTLLDAERGLPTPLRSRIGRAIDLLRTLRLKAPHRRLVRAAYRGRNRAAQLLASKLPRR